MTEKIREDDILRAVVEWLGWTKPNCLYFHVPNESISKLRRLAMHKKGVLPGVPDLLFIGMPHADVGFIELKRDDGVLTPGQKKFRDFCEEKKLSYVLIKTSDTNRAIEMVCNTLKVWGAL